jgi:hypothetical protein
MTPQERKNFESIRDNVHSDPMTQVEAMKLALEALEMVKANADDWQQRTGKEIKGWMQPVNNSITALRQAIEQAQKQEPVAWSCGCCNGSGWVVRDPDIGTDQECFVCEGTGKNIDTFPPQRQPLTDEEILILNNPNWDKGGEEQLIAAPDEEIIEFARAIEAAHGIKGEA